MQLVCSGPWCRCVAAWAPGDGPPILLGVQSPEPSLLRSERPERSSISHWRCAESGPVTRAGVPGVQHKAEAEARAGRPAGERHQRPATGRRGGCLRTLWLCMSSMPLSWRCTQDRPCAADQRRR